MEHEREERYQSIEWAVASALGMACDRRGDGSALDRQARGPTPDHPRTALWYQRLEKPDFTPPSPVYPLAWTSIQAALAYGGYRLMRANSSSERTSALALWFADQVWIGGWSEIFFGKRAPGWGTVASAALGVGAVGYVAAANKVDPIASKLGLPLVAWVAFATLLSEEIWRRNDFRIVLRVFGRFGFLR